MKKILFLFVLTIFGATVGTQKAGAQYYFYNDDYYDNPVLFEIGASLNAMNCLTDIGGKEGVGARWFKDINLGKTTIGGGAFISASFKNAFTIRLEGAFGKLQANDDVLVGITDIAKERYNRNLHFKTTISELSAVVEMHPMFIFIDWVSRDEPPPRYSPYLLAGFGYYSFNPQAQLNGVWFDLQPLSTEGQGFKEYPDRTPYKLKQTNIPVGIGLKYELSQFFNLRGEFVYRKLNTDYLDDVSRNYIDPSLFYEYFSPDKAAIAAALADRQLINRTSPNGGGKRGSPAENDAYFSFNLKLSLILGRERIR